MTEIRAEYIKDVAGVSRVRDEILAAPALGIDAETTGLDPITSKLRLLQIATGPGRAFVFDLFHLAPADPDWQFFIDILADERKVKLFQNAKFDIKFLMRHMNAQKFSTLFDTYLASQLIACGDDTVRHNLAVLAADYAAVELDKTEQTSDFGSTALTQDQLHYAARDAAVLFPIWKAQKVFLRNLDLERVALLEFDCVEAVADLELRGFYLNGAEWQTRYEKQQTELVGLAEALKKHFGPVTQTSLFGEVDIDLESPLQLQTALKRLGVPVEEGTGEPKIKHLANEWPVIRDLLAYREVSTALKMFGPEYLKFISPITGRIHADFRQIGTPTGRFTCNHPNLQQVPGEDLYRNSFQAQGEDRTLIIADYKMIELKIMAQFSRDEKLVEAFRNNVDLHQYTGATAFGLPLEAAAKGTPQRYLGKQLNFATAYGAGKRRFAETAGLSIARSDEALKAYWRLYTGLDVYLKEAEVRAVTDLESHSYSGRTWRFHIDPTDEKSIRDVARLGRNFPIQATCSDILKRAMYLMRNKFRGTATGLVNAVHDEAVTETGKAEAEETGATVRECMVAAAEDVLSIVPAEVELHVSDKWKK
jgi:DNA polymerase-1